MWGCFLVFTLVRAGTLKFGTWVRAAQLISSSNRLQGLHDGSDAFSLTDCSRCCKDAHQHLTRRIVTSRPCCQTCRCKTDYHGRQEPWAVAATLTPSRACPPPQKAWRLVRILLVALVLGLVGAFAGVAVPWLGTAADGARNCVFIIFANIQLVGFAVRVCT